MLVSDLPSLVECDAVRLSEEMAKRLLDRRRQARVPAAAQDRLPTYPKYRPTSAG
jgi:hypothetical protein